LDDIAFGAVTIGDTQTAYEEADRIIQMLEAQAATGNLSTIEQVVEARAREIHHNACTVLKESERIRQSRST
jgi:phytoene/squalene synthetase